MIYKVEYNILVLQIKILPIGCLFTTYHVVQFQEHIDRFFKLISDMI